MKIQSTCRTGGGLPAFAPHGVAGSMRAVVASVVAALVAGAVVWAEVVGAGPEDVTVASPADEPPHAAVRSAASAAPIAKRARTRPTAPKPTRSPRRTRRRQ